MGSRILDFPAASSHVPSVLLDTSVLIYYLEGIEPYNILAKEYFRMLLMKTSEVFSRLYQ